MLHDSEYIWKSIFKVNTFIIFLAHVSLEFFFDKNSVLPYILIYVLFMFYKAKDVQEICIKKEKDQMKLSSQVKKEPYFFLVALNFSHFSPDLYKFG